MKFCVAAVGFLIFLAGCGSVTYPAASGTWSFSLVSNITPSQPPQTLTGTLTTSGDDASAMLTPSSSCFGGTAQAFTGSIDAQATIKLTSTTYNNQSIYFTGTLSPDGSFLTAGTFTITPADNTEAACAGSDSGSITGKRTSAATASETHAAR